MQSYSLLFLFNCVCVCVSTFSFVIHTMCVFSSYSDNSASMLIPKRRHYHPVSFIHSYKIPTCVHTYIRICLYNNNDDCVY